MSLHQTCQTRGRMPTGLKQILLWALVNHSVRPVGSIMAARMRCLGAQGVVVDGRVRDLVTLHETELPIWSRGTSIIGASAQTNFHARNVAIKVGETSS